MMVKRRQKILEQVKKLEEKNKLKKLEKQI